MKKILSLVSMMVFWVFAATAMAAPQKPAIGTFAIGMPKADATKLGAKPTKDPSMLTYSCTWQDVKWATTLVFKANTLATILMQTDINHRIMHSVTGEMEERGYKAISVTGADKKTVFFFSLKAAGKDEEAVHEAFDNVLAAFADAEKGSFVAVYCPEDTFDVLVAMDKNKNITLRAEQKKNLDVICYVLQLNKDNDKMSLMAVELAAMGITP